MSVLAECSKRTVPRLSTHPLLRALLIFLTRRSSSDLLQPPPPTSSHRLRKLTLQVVEEIRSWRKACGENSSSAPLALPSILSHSESISLPKNAQQPLPFMHMGQNYLLKVRSSTTTHCHYLWSILRFASLHTAASLYISYSNSDSPPLPQILSDLDTFPPHLLPLGVKSFRRNPFLLFLNVDDLYNSPSKLIKADDTMSEMEMLRVRRACGVLLAEEAHYPNSSAKASNRPRTTPNPKRERGRSRSRKVREICHVIQKSHTPHYSNLSLRSSTHLSPPAGRTRENYLPP